VLEVLCKSEQSLYNLKKNMNKYPQVLINIKTEAEVNLINNERLSDAVKVIESKLSDKGRVLIRKSGTEPLIRVMVESINSDLANESANYLAEIIKSK
ncbi:MAG: phosphoglucosamine mutase, partial [Candidatus Marinimicrobia bacterium]|nr:phosphoglucosamine mutase [Candidatus Neomarinimicrobiota bacterium]